MNMSAIILSVCNVVIVIVRNVISISVGLTIADSLFKLGQSSMSSLYTRIAIVRSNMHVAVDVNHVIDIQIR